MKQNALLNGPNGTRKSKMNTSTKEFPGFKPRFPLGRLLATPSVVSQIDPQDVHNALVRHIQGDWGDIGHEDWQENELSLKEGFRLFSVYHAANGTKFWVITEADRSATTVLLPEDY